MSRTQSSVKNLATALIGQGVGVIISFIARMIFLDCLNEEYLGLNGLFTNILTVFSLVELGIGPAMNFSLYKPLAEKDTEKVKSIMRLYQKSYVIIGILIMLIGFGFTPFYTIFMEEIPDVSNLTIIYWLFVVNTAVSYFFSYKRALIICDEKRYIATIFRYCFYAASNIFQIIVLVLTGDYILFLIVQIVFAFSENFLVSLKADKMYPFLKEKNVKPLEKETIKDIAKNVKAMLMHKIGGMVVLSTDNIIMSKYVSLTAVGIYSNYYLITDALNKITSQFFISIVASVGNLNALEDKNDKKRLEESFDKTFFLNFWIFGFCSCCLWCLFNPFISLWLGSHLIFDSFTVGVITVNFYLTGMRRSVLTYKEATGVFYQDRYKPLIEAVVNIIASILLAKKLGVAGIFLGTIISTLVMPVWVEPYVLYKYVFKKSSRIYALRFIRYTAVFLIATVICDLCTGFISVENDILCFVIKMLICAIIPNSVFLLFYAKNENFRFFVNLAKRLLKKSS